MQIPVADVARNGHLKDTWALQDAESGTIEMKLQWQVSSKKGAVTMRVAWMQPAECQKVKVADCCDHDANQFVATQGSACLQGFALLDTVVSRLPPRHVSIVKLKPEITYLFPLQNCYVDQFID